MVVANALKWLHYGQEQSNHCNVIPQGIKAYKNLERDSFQNIEILARTGTCVLVFIQGMLCLKPLTFSTFLQNFCLEIWKTIVGVIIQTGALYWLYTVYPTSWG